jgi:hypothetical protein
MSFRIDLFCEDAAHEAFGRAFIERCAAEETLSVTLNVPTARFGLPRLKSEIAAFQSVLRRASGVPDLLVVMVDANDVGVPRRKREIEDALDLTLLPEVVIGLPDPYVERWFLADPASFKDHFGEAPQIAPSRARPDWKECLITALETAGEIVMQGGAEFADDIVRVMDLSRASRAVPSLGTFASDLRAALRRMSIAGG